MFFNINSTFHFSTERNEHNNVKSHNENYKLGKVETVDVFLKENRVLVLTRDLQTSDYLYGFDLEGNLISKVSPPDHCSGGETLDIKLPSKSNPYK